MSRFGNRLSAKANYLFYQEFGDIFTYRPMTQPVNAEPGVDAGRASGDVTVIITAHGIQLGGASFHPRASSEPYVYFMMEGLLADVRKHDVFELKSGAKSYQNTPRRFEVADGPEPIGFGWFKSLVKELTLVAGDSSA